jgi:hypothetical protein
MDKKIYLEALDSVSFNSLRLFLLVIKLFIVMLNDVQM